jgi:hypothetical protein
LETWYIYKRPNRKNQETSVDHEDNKVLLCWATNQMMLFGSPPVRTAFTVLRNRRARVRDSDGQGKGSPGNDACHRIAISPRSVVSSNWVEATNSCSKIVLAYIQLQTSVMQSVNQWWQDHIEQPFNPKNIEQSWNLRENECIRVVLDSETLKRNIWGKSNQPQQYNVKVRLIQARFGLTYFERDIFLDAIGYQCCSII